MASNTGPITFGTGTGTQTFGIGMTPTWFTIKFRGSSIKPSEGQFYGFNQYCYSDESSGPVAKLIQVKNNSGTVVFEGTLSSFSSNNVNFNITINTLGTPTALIAFGN